MRDRFRRLEALEAAAAASSGAGVRSIIIVPVRPILNEDGLHIGGMRGDRGTKDLFKPGGGTTVTIRHPSERSKLWARPEFTVEDVERRAVELKLLSLTSQE